MSLLGVIAVVSVLALASLYGLVRRHRLGRMRDAAQERLDPAALGGGTFGERATLVQFSSAFCRPCVATRHLLGDVAATVPGVRHLEIDAESHLDLVRTLGIASTPTTLVVDAGGVVRRRAVGVPRRAEVLAALTDVVG